MKKKILSTKDGILLLDFVNSSESIEQRAEKISKMSEGCMVSRQVVYNWLFGKTRIPALCKAKIEEIFDTRIFVEFQNA